MFFMFPFAAQLNSINQFNSINSCVMRGKRLRSVSEPDASCKKKTHDKNKCKIRGKR